jgi:hypothetical protein
VVLPTDITGTDADTAVNRNAAGRVAARHERDKLCALRALNERHHRPVAMADDRTCR